MKFLNFLFGFKKNELDENESLERDRYKENFRYELKSCNLEFYFKNKGIINQVFNILKSENIDATLNLYDIEYKKNNNEEYQIRVNNISLNGNKLAWLQTSNADNHLLRVFENDKNFNWIPKTYNQSWNCDCLLLEWFKEYFIFIYKEKHDTYICAIKDENVRFFNFHGEALERKDEIIYFKEYGKDCDDKIDVRRIKIPELEELNPVTVESLRELDLVPKSLDVYEMYLRGK